MYSHLKLIFSVFVMVLWTIACTYETARNDWKLIYHHNDKGEKIEGCKQELIDVVRSGQPIRIYFKSVRVSDSTKFIEHVTDAKFLTITNGLEVFAQIQPIMAQRPNLNSDSLSIILREDAEWTLCVGSNGFSDRVMFQRHSDSILGHNSRPTELQWFTNSSINTNDE